MGQSREHVSFINHHNQPPAPHDDGDFLSLEARRRQKEPIGLQNLDDLELRHTYAVRDPNARSSFSSRGRAIGRTAVYNVRVEGRDYISHSTIIDDEHVLHSAADILPPADIITTHGWMTDRSRGDLYDKHAERQARLGHRVISASHVQNILKSDVTFTDLASDVNVIAAAVRHDEVAERPFDFNELQPLLFTGYSQGAMKAVVGATQANKHGHVVDGLVLNRPALFNQHSFLEAAAQTLPLPVREVPTAAALLLESPRNFIDGMKVFRTTSGELVNHALVVPKMIGGMAVAMSQLDRATDILLTEGARDVFNKDWVYSNYVREHFPNATIHNVTGLMAGHLGCGSIREQRRELKWLQHHNQQRTAANQLASHA